MYYSVAKDLGVLIDSDLFSSHINISH